MLESPNDPYSTVEPGLASGRIDLVRNIELETTYRTATTVVDTPVNVNAVILVVGPRFSGANIASTVSEVPDVVSRRGRRSDVGERRLQSIGFGSSPLGKGGHNIS